MPKSVCIVAMGASSRSFLAEASNRGTRTRVAEEIWAINSMGGVIQHDLLFHMDDCRIQEARAERDPGGNVAGMLTWLRKHPRFITSRAYSDYPGAIEYPLQEVIQSLGNTYFNSTAAYAVAYAIYSGVEKIALYGFDFTYPNLHKAEMGRACVEFWLGIAAAKGIAVTVPMDTTLLDASVPDNLRFYGYDADDIDIKIVEGSVTLTRTPRTMLPTAEEIEQRYNHEPRTA